MIYEQPSCEAPWLLRRSGVSQARARNDPLSAPPPAPGACAFTAHVLRRTATQHTPRASSVTVYSLEQFARVQHKIYAGYTIA
jgi:hypothetical protein